MKKLKLKDIKFKKEKIDYKKENKTNLISYLEKSKKNAKLAWCILAFVIFCGILCAYVGFYVLKVEYKSLKSASESARNMSTYYTGECNIKNAPQKLNITDSYGTNEIYHPKVLYFENGWNGYKYWMSYSPYPKADDSKENPHVMASNDMVNWETPEGGMNPLDPTPKNYKKSVVYNSDPHLVYNNDTDTIECWWRFVDDTKDKMIIYRMTSTDGKTWTSKEIVFDFTRTEKDYLSPAIIYEDGIYKVWAILNNGKHLVYTESSDLNTWSEDKYINIVYNDKDLHSWHLDVIHEDGVYEIILNSFYKEDRGRMSLYYSKSYDNTNYTTPQTVLVPSYEQGKWDNKGLYRSSLLKVDSTYYLFYSGIARNEERGVGVVKGDNILNLCYE